VFAREGYAGTKILDIVREAGVSTGTVYGRFGSKNELLREAVVSSSARMGAAVAEADDLADLFRHTGRMVGHPLHTTEAMRLEAYVTARRDHEVADALAVAHEGWSAAVQPLVDAAEADGTLRGLDPDAVLFLFRMIYLGLLLHRGSGMAAPDPAGWGAVVERVVAALGRPDEGGP
jgi:AcrR family transcriptional regulator